MQIIPVIDILNSAVVHAHQGNRQHYQPITSSLSNTANPVAVIQGFLALSAFKTIYIADLNRLSGKGNNSQLIIKLLNQYPTIQFWIDQGVLYENNHQLPRNWTQVIGTESITDATLDAVTSKKNNLILSLDFKQTLIGSQQLLNTPNHWPKQVIVMTLTKVGTSTGPDWTRLEDILQKTVHSQIIAAGGIRGKDDLIRLSEMGIHSALIASCLHNGQLSGDDINILSGDSYKISTD
jgi:phosphoribosylformimino-5-aminoimidazole carboxamide ribotide isomerase